MDHDNPTGRQRPLSERGRERRERILVAVRHLIDAHGYTCVTMEEIAAQAGVTKKTLYDIYGSKDKLLATAMSRRMQDLLERLQPVVMDDPLDHLLYIVEQTLAAVLEFPKLSKAVEPILLADPGRFFIAEYFTLLHRPCLEDMRTRGWIAHWADIDFVKRAMMFDQIAVQNFWANDLISDTQLPRFAVLSICRILFPVAAGQLVERLAMLSRDLHTELVEWKMPYHPIE